MDEPQETILDDEPKVKNYKPWHFPVVSVLGLLLVAGLAFGAWWYVTEGQPKTDPAKAVITQKTGDEKDLDDIKSDLENDTDLDTTDIDKELSELSAIDLTGI